MWRTHVKVEGISLDDAEQVNEAEDLRALVFNIDVLVGILAVLSIESGYIWGT